MDRQFYTENWNDEQKAFIVNNTQYLNVNTHEKYGFNAYDYICFNKIHCELGIYIDTDGKYKDIYIVLPEKRHFLKIGDANKTTYQEYLNNINKELKARDITIEQLQLIQRFSSLAYYSPRLVNNWKMENNKKIIFTLNDCYGKWSVVDFFLYLHDGVNRSNLKDANSILDDYKIAQGETTDVGEYHIRYFYNGKVEVSKKNKGEFSPDFIARYNNFMGIMERAHKNCIWNTWESGY